MCLTKCSCFEQLLSRDSFRKWRKRVQEIRSKRVRSFPVLDGSLQVPPMAATTTPLRSRDVAVR